MSLTQRWHKITTGWGGGAAYGMGLLNFPTKSQDIHGKPTNATFVVGHPGADWGSSMMTVGYFPHLNLSMALASNANTALNFTRGVYAQGKGPPGVANMFIVDCYIQSAAVQFALPGHAPLACR